MKSLFGILVLMVGLINAAVAGAAGNALKAHPSPYLALHGEDPTHWQPWGAAALAAARRENKLILVSVGYFACHWCHVMQRESFNDTQVAALLNAHFINVKVDRELHPTLDALLMDFTQRTRGHAGWPLNVFLTPAGAPLLGSTYLPREQFLALLTQLNQRWQAAPAALGAMARQAATQLRARPKARIAEPADIPVLAAQLVSQAIAASDELAGGFGDGSKFPSAPQLTALLAAYAQTPDEQLGNLLRYTLFMMASQGLRDHIGGGFFRYTVDPLWQQPHFEKMLYTNAQLITLYLTAGQVLNMPSLTSIAHDTAAFMLRELAGREGGFIASLSAVDGDGVEGGYYLWQIDQLSAILNTDELTLVTQAWKLDEPPVFDAGYLPLQAQPLGQLAKRLNLSPDALRKRFEAMRDKLRTARSQRVLPRDDKQLAAWNGLALSALSRLADVTGQQRYRVAADALAAYLRRVHLRGADEVIRAVDFSTPRRTPLGRAGLADYAYVARGLYDHGTADSRAWAAKLVRSAWRRFWTGAGWRAAEHSLLAIDLAEPVIADGPLHSAAADLAELTLRLADGADTALSAQARRSLAMITPSVQQQPFFHATQISALMHRSRLGAPALRGGD